MRKIVPDIVYWGGVAIVVLVALFTVPLLMTEFSWQAIGIILAAMLGGVVCMAVGKVMKALNRTRIR